MKALTVSNLQKSFQSDFYKKPSQILKGVSFEIQQGRFVGLIGPNGAGKTTTIKCLMEFIFPDSGQIKFFEDSRILQSKSKIGFLPERPYFQEFLTGFEFLKMHWNLSGLKSNQFSQRAAEVLEKVKLSHAGDKRLKDYSKGMLQRIGIAQALLAFPEFLILDEPMSGLDPDGRILIKDILKSFKEQKITTLMSSHLLEDVEELCEDLIIIHKGEVKYSGSIADFKKSYLNLEEAYRAFKLKFEVDLDV